MSENQNLIEQQYVQSGDGWDDAANEAAEQMIRGQLLKFADWRWTTGKEATLVRDGTQLVAGGTVAAWIRWQGGKPVQYLIRRPGERLPERKDLGYDDETLWEMGPGNEKQDPWANTRLVYLLDRESAEAFTFSTSSHGGRSAVIGLADTIARMRRAHPDAAPIVELRSAEMMTQHGRKSKPVFKIVGWKNASGKPAEPVKTSPTVQPSERPKGTITITSGKVAPPQPMPPPIESYDGPEDLSDIPF
jgi:hypothetical protein